MAAGRPRFEPTDKDRQQVTLLVGFGLTHLQICQLVRDPRTGKPISHGTLERHFRKELDSGTAVLNSQVASSLFKKAIGTGAQSAACAIFWAKARMGWRTVDRTELTGIDGGPIDANVRVNVYIPANGRDH